MRCVHQAALPFREFYAAADAIATDSRANSPLEARDTDARLEHLRSTSRRSTRGYGRPAAAGNAKGQLSGERKAFRRTRFARRVVNIGRG
jgi:hypothetical protein